MPESKQYVSNAEITDIDKKRVPTKHYVYIINALWSDGKKQVICRRYNSFFELQTSLIDEFPEESGSNNPNDRILPFLPGKVLFGRSNVREVALKRKEGLNEYLQKLLKLPEKVSRSQLVVDFLQADSDDVELLLGGGEKRVKKEKTADSISDPVLLEQYVVISDFKKTQRNQVSLAAGDTVEVVEKNENGWWFVCIEDEQGWAPSSYLESVEGGTKSDSGDVEEEDVRGRESRHICSKPFKATMPDEVTLAVGDVVDVLAKCSDGWWKVLLSNSKQGYVPLNHLKKIPKNAQGDLMKTVLEEQKKDTNKGKKFETAPRKKTIRRQAKNEKEILQKKKSLNLHDGNSNGKTKNDDENKIAYYANEAFKAEQGKLAFSKGQELEVVEKSPNGWWFVKVSGEEGWVPSTLVQRHRGNTFVNEQDLKEQKATTPKEFYKTLGGYKATEDTGISFRAGQTAEVLEKDACGWWFVKIGDDEGWAPSTFLGELDRPAITPRSSSKEPAQAPTPLPRQPSVKEEGEVYVALSNYQDDDEGMLSFTKGQKIVILEKDDAGWWMGKIGDVSGWVPSNFMKKV